MTQNQVDRLVELLYRYDTVEQLLQIIPPGPTLHVAELKILTEQWLREHEIDSRSALIKLMPI